jgi:hypothetical protein
MIKSAERGREKLRTIIQQKCRVKMGMFLRVEEIELQESLKEKVKRRKVKVLERGAEDSLKSHPKRGGNHEP